VGLLLCVAEEDDAEGARSAAMVELISHFL
jgi:hypothetical protein